MFNYSSYEEEINHPQYRTRVRYQDTGIQRNLNGQLDVTSFLMAVEIQRLVAENTELKISIKQQSDCGLDRVNYEMQIRDLMEKLQQLQQDNYLIGNDNERLKKLIKDLEGSLSRYEIQLRDYDPNWKKELEQQKKQLVQLQKKIGDDDVDDLRSQLSKLKKKLGDYEKQFGGKSPEELQRMLDELQRKSKQFDDLQNKIGGMDPDTLAKKLKELEKLQKSFGGSPEDLLKELERLKKKAKEADDLKKELDKQLRENDKQKNDLDVLDDLRQNAQDLQMENGYLNQQLNDLKNKLRDADQLRTEGEQLKELLKKKDQEIAILKNQLADQQRQLQDTQRQLQDSQRQLQDQLRQLGDLQYKIRQAEQDKLQLQSELNNCLDELDSADGQKEVATQLKDENDKLNQEVDQLNEDKNRLSNENDDLRSRLNDLMRQLQDKDNKLKDLQQDINKKNSELKDLGNKLKEANEKIEWIKNEFGLTDDDLDPKKRKLNSKNVKDSILFANLQPSNLLLNFLLQSAEIERLGIIIDKYYSENESLQNQVKAYKLKNEQISQQLQQQLLLQSQMNQDDEIEKLKEYYENKIVMLTMELSRLRKQQSSSSYQSIPNTQKLQTRPYSQNNVDQGLSKREEDLLSLFVLMGAELQNLRDQNCTLLLQQQEKDAIKGLLTTSGYEGQSKIQQKVYVNEQKTNYDNFYQRELNKGSTSNSYKDLQNTQIVTSTQYKAKTLYDSRQNEGFNQDRIISQQGDNGSQLSYQYQAQIPYRYEQSSQQSGSGYLKVDKYESSRYVN
ncbi:unnamed protein product (macronuclear) [Paramecium tetraurelia]|uniref:Chromosome undetermined scaffold_1, whole genome shotgun sequence n=1 Tax=Paramecium tetraurelia TaxID=5888 RepID=Q6BGH4_PARTE|nr:hypothetical protein [Paramecium tetraurelia strain d4-2]XP_001423468.1 uncharacterized protein GSPATT00000506001 [Paramecium tetraurelia]CAH03246.1 hypothetical protein with coiled-coil domains [Paramecium tetraurelia]CAK56070.1 unnamed protein product [Paramecium tetraurelia]|eukprot:XP_001423468.1 hypothetical protein (macronuclear) [Paramecium tetraurelia strain d4-2]